MEKLPELLTKISSLSKSNFSDKKVKQSSSTYCNISDKRLISSEKENVEGLKFLVGLKPSTFKTFDNKRYNGLIAQDIEELVEKNNFTGQYINLPNSTTPYYTVNYEEFIVPLIQGVKELNTFCLTINQGIDLMKEINTENVRYFKEKFTKIENISKEKEKEKVPDEVLEGLISRINALQSQQNELIGILKSINSQNKELNQRIAYYESKYEDSENLPPKPKSPKLLPLAPSKPKSPKLLPSKPKSPKLLPLILPK